MAPTVLARQGLAWLEGGEGTKKALDRADWIGSIHSPCKTSPAYTQMVTRKQKWAKARMKEVGSERGLEVQAKKNNLPCQGSFQQEQHEGQPVEQEDEALAHCPVGRRGRIHPREPSRTEDSKSPAIA